ncbi:MAG: zinc-binding dehydrogenase [Pseudonocardia sp.]|uniref:zinc-binding dehydrogenase n=1 Tax=unclassified Pseudonocardia TaxID=2619320 RepID=UPI000A6CDE4B|nr:MULTISPECIES: zinc-binding dehydrogenase [unclassified Pseudonocardia]MBN9110729.1 zinc-binding dehydrogenase [Pseudonocardia sp.]
MPENDAVMGSVAALVGRGAVEVQNYPVPATGPGEALLEILQANVCGSDVGIYHHRNPVLRDVVLGHEFVARVAVLGEGLTHDSAGTPVAVGDRVVVVYFRVCGRCRACGRGEFNMCVNWADTMAVPPTQAPHFHGAFASHYHLSAGRHFYVVPDGLTDAEVAGANCGLAQMLFTLERIGVRRGQNVVVQGCGGLGLYACAVAARSGARVIAVERDPDRIAAAARFGAGDVVDMRIDVSDGDRLSRVAELTDGDGADLVIEVTGRPAAFAEAVAFARTGGTIASVGNLGVGPGAELSITPASFTRKNLTVRGFLRYDPWYLRRALDFLLDTRDLHPYGSLSDRVYSLDEIDTAILRTESGGAMRAAVVP